jgi:chromosome partitioning protein
LGRFGSKTAVIVDTAPSLSNIQVSALNAADWLIIPAIPEYAAETGVAALAQTVAALQEAGGKINLLGVLPTMVDSRSREHAETIARWRERFPGLVLPMVRRLIAFGKAPGAGEPIWDYAPNAAEDYAEMMAAILPRLTRQLQRQAVRE